MRLTKPSDFSVILVVAHTWKEVVDALDQSKLFMAPFCGAEDCEDEIKELSKADVEVEEGAPSMGAKSLCIPFNQPKAIEKSTKCIKADCECEPKFYTLFGRSY